MPQSIAFTASISVADGLPLTVGRLVEADATDVVQVDIGPAAGAQPTKKTVNVQPSGAGKVKLLVITSDAYDPADLTYKRVGGNAVLRLDAPQILLGADVIDLLGGSLQKLELSNGTSRAAVVTIYVARDAT